MIISRDYLSKNGTQFATSANGRYYLYLVRLARLAWELSLARLAGELSLVRLAWLAGELSLFRLTWSAGEPNLFRLAWLAGELTLRSSLEVSSFQPVSLLGMYTQEVNKRSWKYGSITASYYNELLCSWNQPMYDPADRYITYLPMCRTSWKRITCMNQPIGRYITYLPMCRTTWKRITCICSSVEWSICDKITIIILKSWWLKQI